MKTIVANWNDLADDMELDGVPIENIVVIVAREFNVAHGLLNKALIEAGKIPTNTVSLEMDVAALVV